MDEQQRLIEVKKGLTVPETTEHFDGVLTQKIRAARAFAINSGVSAEALDSDLGIAFTTQGVADLWNIQGGEARFSKATLQILGQLALI